MRIRTDDVLNDLKTYEDYEFNTILSDIPYNLGSEWIIDKDGTYQIKGKGKAKDFMNRWNGLDGKDLDTMFKEMFRVTKHGGYVLLFGLDRQLGPLHYYATKNGFEINQSLYWYFVSNFPKATDAGKMIDKRLKKDREVVGKKIQRVDGTLRNKQTNGGFMKEGVVTTEGDGYIDITEPSSDLAKIFDGYKYSKAPLKQMVETICVFSKPTKNKSVLDDLIEWGESVDLLNYSPKVSKKERNMGLDDNSIITIKLFEGNDIQKYKEYKLWEKQDLKVVLQVDTELLTRKGIEEFKSKLETNIDQLWNTDKCGKNLMDQFQKDTTSTTKTETQSTIELKTWNWLIELITKEYTLDANSVMMDGGNLVVNVENLNTKITIIDQNKDGLLDSVKSVESKSPLKINIKEKPLTSSHPTLKPINLIYEISKLFKLPEIVNQQVYVPFSGSGSEIIGLLKAGYDSDNITACEMNEEYVEISKKRIKHFIKTNKLDDE